MKNWQRVIICVTLIMSVFAMSISVLAVDPTPVPTVMPDPLEPVISEMVSYYVWQMLNAWGIEVTQSDAAGFTDTVDSIITTWLQEFVDSIPSIYSISTWIAPWQANFDYWGNLRYNQYMVEDVTQFVEWLNDKYGLQNNQTVIINPEFTVGGYPLLQLNTWYSASYQDGSGGNGGYYAIMETSGNNNVIGYFRANATDRQIQGHNRSYIIWVSTTSFTSGNYVEYGLGNLGTPEVMQSGGLAINRTNNHGYYYSIYEWDFESGTTYGMFVPNVDGYTGTYDQIQSFCQNFTINQTGSQLIVTEVINLPTDDSNYSPGDSLTIVDGQPEYSVIDWDGSVTVENLPAVVSTNSIDNPHLEEAYRPIQGLIEYAKDGISICTSLLYELPDELVYMWYGVIASLIIWGMIKLMREH